MGARFPTVREGYYKYRKGKKNNKLCGIKLKLEVQVCAHDFKYRYRNIDVNVRIDK